MVKEKLEGVMQRWHVKDKRSADFFCAFIQEEAKEEREKFYSIVNANRSNKQNSTVHVLFRRMAEGLNDAGYHIPHPFKRDLEIPYSEHSVKELLYRPIIESVYGKSSSVELDTSQFSESMNLLIDAVNRNTGVLVLIPSEESLYGSP